jgi:hypothetical protein
MSVFLVISQWLAWMPSNGWRIKLGEDPIMEKLNSYKLLQETLNQIHSKGIFYLSQVYTCHNSILGLSKWLKAEDIYLQGAASEEWNAYV